jgi:hypothetical protein
MAEREEISIEELQELEGEVLPEREELAVISDPVTGGFTLPVEPPPTE